jgi:hypothetical protein
MFQKDPPEKYFYPGDGDSRFIRNVREPSMKLYSGIIQYTSIYVSAYFKINKIN